ncbi:M48 family metallopeptidase [Bradyrhizobium liaoningense]|uniref:tetratricopeptide repeat protein n=1 Tax=Bradyrhizobium liaoningense TaxID=43992 RepID=UPI001BADBFB2|nr:hypothetical protein [Bradyrhizobium liaoningense]MBR0715069.1 hypothetical protein [Bradyrhizobium liaoningense]
MAYGSSGSQDSPSSGGLVLALKNRDFAIIFDWFASYFFGFAIAGFIALFLGTFPSRGWDSLRIVALSIVFACASTVCGWLLGLLFGIPRTLSRPQAAPAPTPQPGAAPGQAPAAAAPTSRVNTNLEDISDWLTKTLVGVGLTQLYFVPHYLWQAAEKINNAGFRWDGSGQLLAIALFLYFALGGFWLGYVGTRTILTKLLDTIDGPSPAVVETTLQEGLKIDTSGRIVGSTNASVKSADAALLAVPMTALTTPRQLAAWGTAKARHNDLESATVALQEANRVDPSDPVAKQALATVYVAQMRTAQADELLPDDQISDVALFLALYEDPPEGFRKAIRIGQRLAQQPSAATNGNLHVWLACAYGQQHAYEQAHQNPTLADEARKNVVQEVEAALKVDPAAKALLYSLWQPAPNSQENDLASISNGDPDLLRLLAP